jgi:CheY-like chemotaxis protein
MLSREQSKGRKMRSGRKETDEAPVTRLGHAQVIEGLEGLRATLVDRPDALQELDRLLELLRQASRAEDHVYGLPEPRTEDPVYGLPEPRPKVLVVDDNEDLTNLVADAFQELGCETETAFDGPSALIAAKRFRPQVVLLDVGLPVMDGYEVARHLRQEAELTPLKLVAITGYGQSSDKRKSIEAGFDEHLVKPVNIHKLGKLLHLSTNKGPC